MDIKSYLKSASLGDLLQIQYFLKGEINNRESTPKKIRLVKTYSDGASRGNPGPAGIGALVFDEADEKITQEFRYIGETTNNEAEYRALLLALDLARDLTNGSVECHMDSQLLARQLNGQYALKSEKLAKFFEEVKARAQRFSSVTYTHLSREHPKLQMADKLANKGIDEARPLKKI